MPDLKELILLFKHEKDEQFFYVESETLSKEFEDIYQMVDGWKATKFWIDNREIPIKDDRHNIKNTIFCKFRNSCNGLCNHTTISQSRYFFSRFVDRLQKGPSFFEKIQKRPQGVLLSLDKSLSIDVIGSRFWVVPLPALEIRATIQRAPWT